MLTKEKIKFIHKCSGHHGKILDHTDNLMLFAMIEDSEIYSISIYEATKSTGVVHGFLGKELVVMNKRDLNTKTFVEFAKKSFKIFK